jgi:pimeloyl-ACP methyl ester carboxylesterase
MHADGLGQEGAVQFVAAGALEVGYETRGPQDGKPVILLHGFPYDVRAYDDVADRLAELGSRVFVPYLRGYGPTRFVDHETLRSGQQAVLAQDLLDFMDALDIERPIVAGYDWGGRAACIVAALWPERVSGLVTGNGYNIQNIARSHLPALPRYEHQYWYQYYFHSERGRHGLERYRRDLCELLWRLWSPKWQFDAETFARSAESFDNPDFVDVVVHSYRHRYALVEGDASVDAIESALAEQPLISVPTIAIDGDSDGVITDEGSASHARFFSARYERRIFANVGHNIPQEAPADFAQAIVDLQ